MVRLRALIANELPATHGDASAEDRAKARKLLKAVASVIDNGDAAAWRRLAVAYDVIEVSGALEDDEPDEGNVDSTMPAVQFVGDPLSQNIDSTVAIGELKALDLSDTAEDPRAPAGSTLMSGSPLSGSAPVGTGGTMPLQSVPSSVLDIEKYAVLCAWTRTHPDRREQLHAQYGLRSEDERRELDARFEALFTKNLQLRSAFNKRLEMHLGFLSR